MVQKERNLQLRRSAEGIAKSACKKGCGGAQYYLGPKEQAAYMTRKNAETQRLRHYTNKSSAKKIEASGEIKAKDHGKVYFESADKKPLSPQKAKDKHLIKNADSYVETDVPTSDIVMTKNPLTGKSEITVKGSVPLEKSKVVHRKK
ncbi:hypothetical protein [Thalassomonas haliotis]|uniref:Uncharacterized protein n=1 Tax=Thalassomonas haliotis TaxID=485448 RepID=A0ABY7VEE8_9GAMM|nr:hypothetical protein [Thalassomonas haliotis]WDE11751.1 hypothetical protein H3N35_26760 [Thalassomonas haliotis]